MRMIPMMIDTLLRHAMPRLRYIAAALLLLRFRYMAAMRSR